MDSKTPLVVVVSGTSGSGKSTLVAGLTSGLRQRGLRIETLHFDDFTTEEDLPGGDMQAWLARGAPPDEWRTPALEQRLSDLRDGLGSVTGGLVDVVLVEEPFGRARTSIGHLTDYAIHLSLPLHIALARRLLRQFVPPVGGLDDNSATQLRDYLSRYLDLGAELYGAVETAAVGSADVSLDATRASAHLVEEAVAAVVRQFPGDRLAATVD